MKIKVERKEIERLVLYHAREAEGLEPVIETDADLKEWAEWTITKTVLPTDEQSITVTVFDEYVLIDADVELVSDIRLSYL